MVDNRVVVGHETNEEFQFKLNATNKMRILNEAVTMAEGIVKVDRVQFAKGFSDYVFKALIEQEPKEKRAMINKDAYCKMYNVPMNELNALQQSYEAFQGMVLSDSGTYFLLPDFNIYLVNEAQIRVYDNMTKICRMFNSHCRGQFIPSMMGQATKGYIRQSKTGELEPNVYLIKRNF